MKVGEDATPPPAVATTAVVEAPNRPLAPAPGAVNVTFTPSTGRPDWVSVAWRGSGKDVFTAVVCGVPPVAASA